MGNKLPIIVVHKGTGFYLPYVFKQAKKYNNDIYLLGDESNKEVCDNWYDYRDYDSERRQLFRERYVHMSTLSHGFEQFCFERHFLVYEFARRHNLDKFVVMDSDVLLYKQITVDMFEDDSWASYHMGEGLDSVSPHFSYFRLEKLEQFLDFCLCLYLEPQIEVLRKRWEKYQQDGLPGGNCDMTALFYWMKTDGSMRNLHDENEFNGVIDTTVGQKYDIDAKRGIIKIRFDKSGNATTYIDGKSVQMVTLHAQGRTKLFIPYLYKRKNNLFDFKWTIYKDKLLNWLHGIKELFTTSHIR